MKKVRMTEQTYIYVLSRDGEPPRCPICGAEILPGEVVWKSGRRSRYYHPECFFAQKRR